MTIDATLLGSRKVDARLSGILWASKPRSSSNRPASPPGGPCPVCRPVDKASCPSLTILARWRMEHRLRKPRSSAATAAAAAVSFSSPISQLGPRHPRDGRESIA